MACKTRSNTIHLVFGLLTVLSITCMTWCKSVSKTEENYMDHKDHKHGGVKMGVINHGCDNAKWRVEIDWDNSTDYDYTCQEDEPRVRGSRDQPLLDCLDKQDIPEPWHKCMNEKIVYNDIPPRGGPHRPLWPVYGEYLYLPPQRWLHSLEHGAAVFLYHPCADPAQIQEFKNLAKGCLRRRIVTPYRELIRDQDPSNYQPFAVVTWGCKLMLGHIDEDDENDIADFIRKTAIKTDEKFVSKHGQYDLGLLEKAEVVSDMMDTIICPRKAMTAENMVDHVENE